jgi:hypothetical protein
MELGLCPVNNAVPGLKLKEIIVKIAWDSKNV